MDGSCFQDPEWNNESMEAETKEVSIRYFVRCSLGCLDVLCYFVLGSVMCCVVVGEGGGRRGGEKRRCIER